jgi:hypothetical protein
MLVRRHKRRIEIEQNTLRIEQTAGFPPAPSTKNGPAVVVPPAEDTSNGASDGEVPRSPALDAT